jgi:hypothetical protein
MLPVSTPLAPRNGTPMHLTRQQRSYLRSALLGFVCGTLAIIALSLAAAR